jgi:uncharacterized protein YndB with AHSA1/START domain
MDRSWFSLADMPAFPATAVLLRSPGSHAGACAAGVRNEVYPAPIHQQGEAMAEKKRSVGMLLLKLAALFVLVIIAAVVGTCAYGNSKPEAHTASGSETINAPVGEVFALQADVLKTPQWTGLVKEVRDYKENPDGTASWLEIWNDGNEFDMKRTAYVKDKLLRVEIQDRAEVFHGSWTFDFAEANGGTRVTITEEGTIPSAFIRGMYHLVANTDDTLKNHLQLLKKEAEKRAAK